MNLVWHIARKDLQRLALPLAFWLVLVVAPVVAFVNASPSTGEHPPSQIDGWRGVFSIWLQLLLGVQLFLGYLLAGTLVLEDPIAGTKAFWSTRPIGRGRLLAAKLLAAFVAFVVAPIVVLMPLWFAQGFSPVDAAVAGWDLLRRFGGGVVLALLAASLARTLAQFLFYSLLLTAAFFATAWGAAYFSPPVLWAVGMSREWVIVAATVPLLALGLLHQFLARRAMRTWLLLGVMFVAIFAMRLMWPWEINAATSPRRPIAPKPEDRAAEIVAAPSFTQHRARSLPQLYGRTAWSPDGFSVPMTARSADGKIQLRASDMWMEQAALRVADRRVSAEPLRWQLFTLGRGLSPKDDAEPEFTGTLEAWSVRPRIIGELPVRLGAELRVGADQTRILDLLFHEDRLDNIYIEERGPDVRMRAAWSDNWSRRDQGNVRYVDCYVLVNREKKIASSAYGHDLGSLEAGGLAVRFRDLSVAWRETDRGAPTLVRVRFERDHTFTLPLHVRGVTTRGFEQIR